MNTKPHPTPTKTPPKPHNDPPQNPPNEAMYSSGDNLTPVGYNKKPTSYNTNHPCCMIEPPRPQHKTTLLTT